MLSQDSRPIGPNFELQGPPQTRSQSVRPRRLLNYFAMNKINVRVGFMSL